MVGFGVETIVILEQMRKGLRGEISTLRSKGQSEVSNFAGLLLGLMW